jgi:hypothetical protein
MERGIMYQIELDCTPGLNDSEERFTIIYQDGRIVNMRLHDYDKIYEIPGLYEEIVQDILQCNSPRILAQSLADVIKPNIHTLRVLDLGAGTGVVGQELQNQGIKILVGSDMLLEAKNAVSRDRPNLYLSYIIDDGSSDSLDILSKSIIKYNLNTLACAGAIGDNHITLTHLSEIWSLFPYNSWIVLTGSSEDFDKKEPDILLTDLDYNTKLIYTSTFCHRLRMDGNSIDGHSVIVGHK